MNKRIKTICAIIIVSVILILVISNSKNQILETNEISLEDEMSMLAEKYYNEQIKGKVFGINEQIITLVALKRAKYDIKKFEKICDLNKSYSVIKIENPNEQNIKLIKYKIENHLNCEA